MTLTRQHLQILAILLATLAAVLVAPRAAGAAGPDEAEAALERARRHAAGLGPFTETLDLRLTMPDGSTSSRRQIYGVGADGRAFFRLLSDGSEAFRIVAAEGRVVAVQAHVGGRYAEAAFVGGFDEALAAIEAGQAQLAAPPSVVAAQGGDAESYRQALRYAILGPLEAVAVAPAPAAGEGGLVEVELAAANGRAWLGVDEATGRLATLRVTLGEGDEQIRADGTFELAVGDPGEELAFPDISARASVPTLPALTASEYPLGDPAPSVVAAALDGEPVDLGALGGQVVVLDFWATWCVPCWTALEHTEELTRWAKESSLPVRVFAVDSLERSGSLEAQRDQARAFLTGRDLELDVLVDHDNAVFAAFHNPGLPSLVIVDAEGRLAEYQSGLVEDMVETVRARVLELADAAD